MTDEQYHNQNVQLAGAIRHLTYNLQQLLAHATIEYHQTVFAEMHTGAIAVGDLVIETSTIRDPSTDGIAVGYVRAIKAETEERELATSNADGEHDKVLVDVSAVYLILLDGTEHRWVDAKFAKVLNYHLEPLS